MSGASGGAPLGSRTAAACQSFCQSNRRHPVKRAATSAHRKPTLSWENAAEPDQPPRAWSPSQGVDGVDAREGAP